MISVGPVSQAVSTPSVGDAEALREEVVSCYINLLYLSGLSNALLVGGLRDLEPTDEGYAQVSALTEQTFVSFRHIQGLLNQLDESELEANANFTLLQETLSDIAPR